MSDLLPPTLSRPRQRPQRWGARPIRLGLLQLTLAGLLLSLGAAHAQDRRERRQLQHYRLRLEQLFEQLDQNHDGRLSRREVQGHPYLERHFERLDRSGRGSLRREDLTPGHPNLLGERLLAVFQRADRNGDGLMDRREASAFPMLLERFESLDGNGDERVSLEELTAAQRQLAPRRRAGD